MFQIFLHYLFLFFCADLLLTHLFCPRNARKLKIFTVFRLRLPEILYFCIVFRKRHCSSFQNELAPQNESEQN